MERTNRTAAFLGALAIVLVLIVLFGLLLASQTGRAPVETDPPSSGLSVGLG